MEVFGPWMYLLRREFSDHILLPWQKANNAEFWCFLCSLTESAFKQTDKFPVIWDAMAMMWHEYNAAHLWYWWGDIKLKLCNTVTHSYWYYHNKQEHRGSLLLTWIDFNPAWISDSIHYKVWDEITYPLPNFNGTTVEVWEWISNFIHLTGHVITCWD